MSLSFLEGLGFTLIQKKEGVPRLGFIIKGSKLLEKLWCCIGRGV